MTASVHGGGLLNFLAADKKGAGNKRPDHQVMQQAYVLKAAHITKELTKDLESMSSPSYRTLYRLKKRKIPLRQHQLPSKRWM